MSFKSGRQKCIIDISAGLQSAVLRLCDGMAACVQTRTVILANGLYRNDASRAAPALRGSPSALSKGIPSDTNVINMQEYNPQNDTRTL